MNQHLLNLRCAAAWLKAAAVVLSLALMSGSAVAIFDDDDQVSTEVECYRANPSDYAHEPVEVGHVVIYSGQQPAGVCNQEFYGCQGQCAACVFDYDYSADVCIDMAGNRFLK